jgi:hypothetical protein
MRKLEKNMRRGMSEEEEIPDGHVYSYSNGLTYTVRKFKLHPESSGKNGKTSSSSISSSKATAPAGLEEEVKEPPLRRSKRLLRCAEGAGEPSKFFE